MTRRITPTAGRAQEAKKGPARKKRKLPSKDAKKAKGAGAQKLREAGPIAVATRLADREYSGDIDRRPEEDELHDEDLIDAEAVDTEVSLEDEDFAILEDLDRIDPSGPVGLRPGERFSGEDRQESDEAFQYELRIEDDGSCRFLRPAWIRGDGITIHGESDFDEIGLRLDIFEALASWLEKERPGFLRNPEPLALGVNALEEMKRGLPSVSPRSFLEISEIDDIIPGERKNKESRFSRYSSATNLVWEDGSSLPLKFLFGREARMGWAACAVMQFLAQKGKRSDEDVVSELRQITRPKFSSDRSQLAESEFTSLTIDEIVALANELADTSWEEVFVTHFKAAET